MEVCRDRKILSPSRVVRRIRGLRVCDLILVVQFLVVLRGCLATRQPVLSEGKKKKKTSSRSIFCRDHLRVARQVKAFYGGDVANAVDPIMRAKKLQATIDLNTPSRVLRNIQGFQNRARPGASRPYQEIRLYIFIDMPIALLRGAGEARAGISIIIAERNSEDVWQSSKSNARLSVIGRVETDIYIFRHVHVPPSSSPANEK